MQSGSSILPQPCLALVVAEHNNKTLAPVTLQVVSAAVQCVSKGKESQQGHGQVHVLVAGHGCASVAQAASQMEGVSKVWWADGPALEHGLAENLAAQVLRLMNSSTSGSEAAASSSPGPSSPFPGFYSHLLFAATLGGKSTAPRVAALLGVPQVSEATQVINSRTFERFIYAGNALVRVQSLAPQVVLTVRTSAFEPVAAQGGQAVVEAVAAVPADGRSQRVAYQAHLVSSRPELAAAKVVVSGGRALGSREQFEAVLGPLADVLGGALGATRAAVDAGYAPNDWQVGQTGKVVAPQLYIACGLSGAVQHLAGMRGSKTIVAINQDTEAPICAVANYTLQADVFKAVPEMVALLLKQ